MKTRWFALSAVSTFITVFAVGRWWFDASGASPRLSSRLTPGANSIHRVRIAEPPAANREPPPLFRVPATPALPSAGDDVLETMMTQHRDAMLMLREATYYELFRERGRFAPCLADVPSNATCWVRFQCTLRGQLMDLQVVGLDCRMPDGRPIAQDDRLLPCIRDQLTTSDPIGIPAEAATDLGDYVGPLEVVWYVK